jgi:hypothetical protein
LATGLIKEGGYSLHRARTREDALDFIKLGLVLQREKEFEETNAIALLHHMRLKGYLQTGTPQELLENWDRFHDDMPAVESLTEEFAKPERTTFIARKNRTPIGSIGVKIEKGKNTARIGTTFVNEEHRKSNVATALGFCAIAAAALAGKRFATSGFIEFRDTTLPGRDYSSRLASKYGSAITIVPNYRGYSKNMVKVDLLKLHCLA